MKNFKDLSTTESFLQRTKSKSLKALHSLSFTETIVFYSFLVLFAGSALFMLAKVNEYFTIEVPVAGGSIKEGVIGFPRYINPILSVTDAGKDLALLVYSGVLRATPEGEIVPDLAESYSVSPDGLTYEVMLKDNVFFHDGEPVTTRDVEFTIKKSLDPVLKSPKAASWQGVMTEVVDDRTIRFTLRQAYGPFLENLTLGILPEHIWRNIDSEAFPFSQFNFEPIGSGPYKISSIKLDDSGLPLYYHFVPFKEYALGAPYIKDIYMHFFSNEEKMLDAFNKGTIDHVSSISPQKAKELSIQTNINIMRASLPRIFGVFINQNEAPVLADKAVRKALSVAVDRNSLIEDSLYGFGTVSNSPLPASISSMTDTFIPEGERIIQANEILSKGGWTKDSAGKYVKKDKKGSMPLSFSISTSNVPELKAMAYLLKETWEKLGASIEVKVFDLADLNQNIIRQRKYDTLLFGEAIGRDLDLYAFWHSSERNDPGLNVSMYTNSKVDKLLEEARKTEDRLERIGIYKKLEIEIAADMPAIFLYSPDFIYITNPKVKGINIGGIVNASERYLGIENWYMYTQKIWTIFDKKN